MAAHKDLTDPQLHEPKGASTATLNQTMFSDGNGGTSWDDITLSKINFSPEPAYLAHEPAIVAPFVLDSAAMSAVTDRHLSDAVNFTQANKNTKELAKSLEDVIRAYNALYSAHLVIINDYNNLVTALIKSGFVQEGDI